MEINETIVSQFEQVLKDKKVEKKQSESSKSISRANDLYNKMLDEGLIKKRGYTLRGIEDSHLYQFRLNS